ncbi:MAG: hypothetical protein JJ992_05730, partial [Planctomycetes bacterium]|nr:hypothetical protein [Planctomycetota bacterium]
MISGLILKHLKGERLVIWKGDESLLTGSSQVPLARPSRHAHTGARTGGDERYGCLFPPRYA